MSLDVIENPMTARQEAEHTLGTLCLAIDETLERAMLYDVCSQWSAEEAMNLIARVKGYGKRIDEIRKRLNEPYRKMVTYNNEKCRPFLENLERIEKILTSKIISWQRKHEIEQEEMQKDAELLKESLRLDVTPYVQRDSKLRTSEAMTYEKKQWKYEIECLAMVPINYVTIDEEKIEAALKAGVRNIPGLKIYEEKKTIIRSR